MLKKMKEGSLKNDQEYLGDCMGKFCGDPGSIGETTTCCRIPGKAPGIREDEERQNLK